MMMRIMNQIPDFTAPVSLQHNPKICREHHALPAPRTRALSPPRSLRAATSAPYLHHEPNATAASVFHKSNNQNSSSLGLFFNMPAQHYFELL
jgi:hypothetical protein